MDSAKWIILPFLFAQFYSTLGAGDDSRKFVREVETISETIFHKYNSGIIPIQDGPVKVNVEIDLVQIKDLDLQREVLETVVDMSISWLDYRLFFYPQQVMRMITEHDDVWTPDFAILNAVESPQMVTDSNLVIEHSGTVHWFRRLRLKTFCPTNVTADSQECDIRFGSKVYTSDQLVLDAAGLSFETDSLYPSHEWEMTDSGTDVTTVSRGGNFTAAGNYTEVTYLLSLSQKVCEDCMTQVEEQKSNEDSSNIAVMYGPSLISTLIIALLAFAISRVSDAVMPSA